MNRQPVILLVEDNPAILEANRQALAHEGYRIETAITLSEARKQLAENPPDAIVLDIMLPDGNGLDFLRELREGGQIAPVLLLTSLIKKDERLEGLRAGGDDYITKPYDIDELRARVAAFLRRVKMDRESATPAEVVTLGPLALDLTRQRGTLQGEDLRLTPKEFILLLMLVQSEGEALARETLYEAAWQSPMGTDSGALWRQISALKRKLGDAYFDLSAQRGFGYMLKFID